MNDQTEIDDAESTEMIMLTLGGEEPPSIDFFTACSHGLRNVVGSHLLNQDMNEQNKGGWTGLMYACAAQKNNIVSYFLHLGADVTLADDMGRTFLSVAAENGNFTALNSLKLLGFDSIPEEQHSNFPKAVRSIINLRERRNGYTPLMLAAIQGSCDMVGVLLSFGADLRITDFEGRTAFDLASLDGHKGTARMLKFSDSFTVRELLEDIGIEEYAHLFKELTVDKLLLFDEEDLKALGLKLLGPRKKLGLVIEKIKALKMNRRY